MRTSSVARLPDKVHVLAELERCGISYSWASSEEVVCLCPFHEDHSPSCNINTEKRLFKCQACKQSGDFVTFLAGALRSTRAVVMVDLSKRYDLEDGKVIHPDTVERYHSRIWEAKPLLKELYARGVTDAAIRRYRLGVDDGRITIPIQNESGLYVNIRRYLPGAPGKDKMRNTRGYGRIRLYPVEQLQYDRILIVGGEVKAIVAAQELNAHGIGVITTTAGEGNWDQAFTAALAGKPQCWVCMDVDEEGKAAAEIVCAQVYRAVDWLGRVDLPLDKDQFPKGDINDYVAEGNLLSPLLVSCKQWEPAVPEEEQQADPVDSNLLTASHADYANKRVRIKAVVSAMDTAPYAVPRSVFPLCDKSQKECVLCPVFPLDRPEFTVPPESPSIIEMVSTTRGVQRESLMRALRIPVTCKSVEFRIDSYYNVEDTRLSPQLEITNRSADRVMQPALCIGDGVELNESYDLIGRMHPHPRTQQATMLFSKYKATQDALSNYKPSNLEQLDFFRPNEWTEDGIRKRLHDVYADLEANVTRIFKRREMHLAMDLAYHSPLLIEFDGKSSVKGWVEVLIIGDSSQGKSETFDGLMNHYKLGEKVECKNATVAGLLGGLQQMGSRWFVSWGVIPTHDKRLVCLEELKGASVDVIGKLTDMRSRGVAEIPKIEKRRTHARTRLVAISNPRSDRPLSAYNFGVEAIKELIGGLEDLRRFDLVLVVSKDDVPPDMINKLQQDRPHIPHTHESKLCRDLLLWSWTRAPQEVEFVDGSTEAILGFASSLCSEFSDALPIVDRGSMRMKLARLSASIACRTFSTSKDRLRVQVLPCHVEFINSFLLKHYSSPSFGYKEFTQAVRINEELIDPELVTKKINDTPFPRDFARQCLHKTHIELCDIQDWTGWDRTEALNVVSLLVRKHAIVRHRGAYHKTPPFIQLLRAVLENGKLVDRPDHIEEF